MKRLIPAIFVLVVFSALGAAAAAELRGITVQGSGSASGRPDMAVVRTGVETRATTPDQALAANTRTMTALAAVLQRFRIAERDMETASFHVAPVYAPQPGARGTAAIEGYQVTNELAVRVRDLASLGALLSALVEGGANRLHGVSFQIGEPAALRAEARRAAMRDARGRAELYAAAAGVRLGRVVSISETGAPPPLPLQAQAMRVGGETVPIATGEQTVSASVTVAYEIE